MMREVMTLERKTLRIEALTLTTSLENTMTIKVKILNAPDISVRNEVLNLRCMQEQTGRILSAASFLIAGSGRESLSYVLSFIFQVVGERMPKYDIWLLIGHSAWQPDTRITRYRKLWGGLKARGVEVLGDSRSQEIVVEIDGKLKFFGATCLSISSIDTVVDALLEERCSYLVAAPQNFDVSRALKVGWSGELSEDLSFFGCVFQLGGLVLKLIGEFDDFESGFVSVGSPEVVGRLLD